MDISVVIPLYNEAESLKELTDSISVVMKNNSFSYEIILIDDGSNDNSWSIIGELSKSNQNIKGIKFRRNYGKSAALNVGFHDSLGEVVITMDADLQDSPDEIPELYRMVKKQGFDLVSGWKKKRYDPISKTLPTKLFNWATRKTTGIKLHDFNCGLKAYKSDVIKCIEVYGEMHRYIPVIAKWAGFVNIGEKIVVHQKRKYGKTKFGGMARFINGFLDLMTISFVSRFGKRPMHLFGLLGTLIFFLGFAAALWLGIEKIIIIMNGGIAPRVTASPYFYIALTSMIIGTQLFMAGFLAELISRNSAERNKYLVQKKINIE
ncbi:MAG: glycosyltransferase family 2 protein [Bacteroidales bacterium]|nr:glycosyltransferase family 2 protein [Bacteroidales bacterium]